MIDPGTTICKKCNTKSSPDSNFCKKCGTPIGDGTNYIELGIQPGQIIGERYEIIHEHGKGKMGIVYKANDQKLDRIVALKTLKFDIDIPSRLEKFRKRMIIEAKAAAKLKHPNIVTIYDVGSEKDMTYISMEFIEGKSLSDLIDMGGLPDIDLIVNIILQICDAMSHAHDKGIIHRDLKPSNIMCIDDKTIKLADFGIAKMPENIEGTISEGGAILGTPPYMAPERFEGNNNDPRSDIFAMGIIIYELLTGFRPFKGNSFTEIMFKVLNGEYTPIKEYRNSAPDYFEKIVAKAIEKHPDRRYQHFNDLKLELEKNIKAGDIVVRSENIRSSCWFLPYHRNSNFTGRDDLLLDLQKFFITKDHSTKIIVLHGLGGVGKTQLVVEYSYRNIENYSLIFWIRSEEPATLASDYVNLAERLDLPVKNLRQEEIIKIVRSKLEQLEGWLLIFDNAISPSVIEQNLPRSDKGHVIITSRYRNWGVYAAKLEILEMKIEDSIEFLLKRTNDRDKKAAAELSKALGNLPLALEQAGAYIESTGRRISDYFEMLKKYQKKLLTRGKPSTDYPETVASTWELSLKKVSQESPVGVDLINLCSFFAPNDFPMKILHQGSKYLPKSLAAVVNDPLEFDDVVVAVRAYSLIGRSGDNLSIHRLVQAVIHDRLEEDERHKWADIAILLIN
ncbi:protein kinase, partial [bacterium]|nr:protein kinase [bacterium]